MASDTAAARALADELRRAHWTRLPVPPIGVVADCRACYEPWPCAGARAAESLTALADEVERLTALNDALRLRQSNAVAHIAVELSLARRLRHARIMRATSLHAASKALGVRPTTLSGWERGEGLPDDAQRAAWLALFPEVKP